MLKKYETSNGSDEKKVKSPLSLILLSLYYSIKIIISGPITRDLICTELSEFFSNSFEEVIEYILLSINVIIIIIIY